MRLGKLLAAIFGSLILLAGAAMTTGGAIAMAVTDGDGWVHAPTACIETDTAAVVGSDISIDLGEAIDERTFVSFSEIPARIEVDSRNDQEIFVGIARTEDVEAYLAGGSYVRADFFSDDVSLSTTVGGSELGVPSDEDFWVASTTEGNLDWDLASGNWSVVVANADGSAGVDIAVTGAARIPFVEALAIGLLIVGVLSIVGGAIMLYFGVRTDPRRQIPVAPTRPNTPDSSPEPAPVV